MIREELEKNLRKIPAQEHILNLFKAGLSTAPFCGEFATLISDYIPSQRQVRFEEFILSLSEDLEKF